jgi:DNA-binding GntR family transcriptional regulator
MPAQLVSIEVAPDLVDQVYRALLGAISSGTLAPGERITQEDIAQRLSVSRQPVLQALRLLKKDGFVRDAPGRGVLVAPLEAEAMRKVYQVRGALDVLAARLAAQQRFRIDPKLIERGRRAARGRNVEAMLDADVAFHQAIYEASGNPLIGQSAARTGATCAARWARCCRPSRSANRCGTSTKPLPRPLPRATPSAPRA